MEKIAEAALAAGLRRDDAFVAVGGGVVDGRGRVCRGDPPARRGLECRADDDGRHGRRRDRRQDRRQSSLAGKNLLGAFHPPRAVLSDPACLATLPDRDYRAGLVEAYKAAWVADAELSARASESLSAVLARDGAALVDAAGGRRARQGRNRRQPIPRDAGRRHLLNFGHTLGHALEARRRPGARSGTARRSRGESPRRWKSPKRRAGLSEEDAAAIRRTLSRLGPFPQPERDPKRLAPLLALDKKATAAGTAGVLLEAHRAGAGRGFGADSGVARRGGYNVVIVSGGSGRRRIRLFVLLSGALILASLVPLLVAEAVLIRRNRRTLETLEEKYLTRSSAAIADHISAYYGAAAQQLTKAGDAIRLAVQLTGKDPFGSTEGAEILGGVLQGQNALVALRAVNLDGQGSFVGPDLHSPEMNFEFRKGFESARDGVRYAGEPLGVPEIGIVAVLATPVSTRRASGSASSRRWRRGPRSSRSSRTRPGGKCARRSWTGAGRILFPPATGGEASKHPSSLVADFVRFPARLTRSESTPSGSVLASISPVGDPPWGVLVERDRNLAFASVDRMVRDTVVWSAVCLAGALLLGLLFARRLSRPITQLADSTRAVAQGEYGTKVEVAGTAEIADLSENFNTMSVVDPRRLRKGPEGGAREPGALRLFDPGARRGHRRQGPLHPRPLRARRALRVGDRQGDGSSPRRGPKDAALGAPPRRR